MSEHTIQMAMLVFVVLQVAFVGYLAYRAHRSSQWLEAMLAATYLEARRALGLDRPR